MTTTRAAIERYLYVLVDGDCGRRRRSTKHQACCSKVVSECLEHRFFGDIENPLLAAVEAEEVSGGWIAENSET